jgi:2-amino-4-hydroxy-6-hydroxymethyldihydropteridine diphosphokinase
VSDPRAPGRAGCLRPGGDPRAPGRAGCLRPGLRTGYLGLGSNQGDRLANLRAARAALPRRGVEPAASSSVYETAPQGEVTDQPDFLNACLRVRTDLEPEELLDACKAVERELGRAPGGVRHGPRPIDVDVLLLGDAVHRSERLTLPHPEVATRRFVLEPLLELDPELRLPGGPPLRELLPAVLDQRVTPHAGGSWRHEVERGAPRGQP